MASRGGSLLLEHCEDVFLVIEHSMVGFTE